MDALTNKPEALVLATSTDLLRDFAADKRSKKTRHEYQKDLIDFFRTAWGTEPTPQRVTEFLEMDRFTAIALVLRYKEALIVRGLKEATVNRRLSAIKSLVNYANKIGRCNYTLVDIKSEKVRPYRDTTGIKPSAFKQMLQQCDRSTLRGLRDYAILCLLWDAALRRGEVTACNIGDLDLDARKLWILGKGRGTNKEAIGLPRATVTAILEWLLARKETNIKKPLFIAVDSPRPGGRLSTNAIYRIVQGYAEAAGIRTRVSPHRIRHSSVTAALEATNGDVRRVQKLSRHANLNTLMLYDDARLGHQEEISGLLADLRSP